MAPPFGWTLRFGPVAVSPHFFLESLAYVVGFALYNRARQRQGDVLHATVRSSIIVAAILGAAFGSKLLFWLEDPAQTLARWNDFVYLMGGKTIVGAILGGTIAVEVTKHWLGITSRTGDLFTIPLMIGMAIGRVGCFLAGLDDHTYGVATSLPWGVDFGDGIPRHPTQLYEVIFLLAAAAVLHGVRRSLAQGGQFRAFLILYLGWRLAVDFLKPDVHVAGLSMIQWTCVIALVWYLRDAAKWFAPQAAAEATANHKQELLTAEQTLLKETHGG